jgi:rootletin
LEAEKHNLERTYAKTAAGRSKSYERPEKESSSDVLEQENRELRMRVLRLETQLVDKEAEITRLRSQLSSDLKPDRSAEIERLRAAQLQAERLLEAREQSHRQQVLRLENQVITISLPSPVLTGCTGISRLFYKSLITKIWTRKSQNCIVVTF